MKNNIFYYININEYINIIFKLLDKNLFHTMTQ